MSTEFSTSLAPQATRHPGGGPHHARRRDHGWAQLCSVLVAEHDRQTYLSSHPAVITLAPCLAWTSAPGHANGDYSWTTTSPPCFWPCRESNSASQLSCCQSMRAAGMLGTECWSGPIGCPAPPRPANSSHRHHTNVIEGSLLVALTGCAPDNAWVGCNARPQAAVPASFQQHGQVCCGVYCSMLMAIWTAAATGHNMQLLSPLDVSQPAGPCLAGHGPLQQCPAPMAVSITACMCTVVDVAS